VIVMAGGSEWLRRNMSRGGMLIRVFTMERFVLNF
jgi:hypothetical protein